MDAFVSSAQVKAAVRDTLHSLPRECAQVFSTVGAVLEVSKLPSLTEDEKRVFAFCLKTLSGVTDVRCGGRVAWLPPLVRLTLPWLDSLTHLSLDGIRFCGKNRRRRVAQLGILEDLASLHMPALTHLSLVACFLTPVAGPALTKLFQRQVPNLMHLDLSSNPRIGDIACFPPKVSSLTLADIGHGLVGVDVALRRAAPLLRRLVLDTATSYDSMYEAGAGRNQPARFDVLLTLAHLRQVVHLSMPGYLMQHSLRDVLVALRATAHSVEFLELPCLGTSETTRTDDGDDGDDDRVPDFPSLRRVVIPRVHRPVIKEQDCPVFLKALHHVEYLELSRMYNISLTSESIGVLGTTLPKLRELRLPSASLPSTLDLSKVRVASCFPSLVTLHVMPPVVFAPVHPRLLLLLACVPRVEQVFANGCGIDPGPITAESLVSLGAMLETIVETMPRLQLLDLREVPLQPNSHALQYPRPQWLHEVLLMTSRSEIMAIRQLVECRLSVLDTLIIMLGDSFVGKTSVAKALRVSTMSRLRRMFSASLKSIPLDQRTIGVDVTDIEPAGSAFRYRVWDFAGQEVYYATHHLFLGADALYVIVIDPTLAAAVLQQRISRRDADALISRIIRYTEDNPLTSSVPQQMASDWAEIFRANHAEYWLRSILRHRNGARIGLIATHANQMVRRPSLEMINRTSYWMNMAFQAYLASLNIVPPTDLRLSVARLVECYGEHDARSQLRSAVFEHACHPTTHASNLYPAYLGVIFRSLDARGSDDATARQWPLLMSTAQLQQRVDTLLGPGIRWRLDIVVPALENTGRIMHWRDGTVDWLVTQPGLVIRLLNTLINHEDDRASSPIAEFGWVQLEVLYARWKQAGFPAVMHPELLQLLQHMQLAYRARADAVFVPALLPRSIDTDVFACLPPLLPGEREMKRRLRVAGACSGGSGALPAGLFPLLINRLSSAIHIAVQAASFSAVSVLAHSMAHRAVLRLESDGSEILVYVAGDATCDVLLARLLALVYDVAQVYQDLSWASSVRLACCGVDVPLSVVATSSLDTPVAHACAAGAAPLQETPRMLLCSAERLPPASAPPLYPANHLAEEKLPLPVYRDYAAEPPALVLSQDPDKEEKMINIDDDDDDDDVYGVDDDDGVDKPSRDAMAMMGSGSSCGDNHGDNDGFCEDALMAWLASSVQVPDLVLPGVDDPPAATPSMPIDGYVCSIADSSDVATKEIATLPVSCVDAILVCSAWDEYAAVLEQLHPLDAMDHQMAYLRLGPDASLVLACLDNARVAVICTAECDAAAVLPGLLANLATRYGVVDVGVAWAAYPCSQLPGDVLIARHVAPGYQLKDAQSHDLGSNAIRFADAIARCGWRHHHILGGTIHWALGAIICDPVWPESASDKRSQLLRYADSVFVLGGDGSSIAVADAARRSRVPWTVVKGVAGYADGGDMQTWRSYAAHTAVTLLRAALAAL